MELVLVLAIVALLAGLALPELAAGHDAWQRRRAQAQQAELDRAAARLARDRGLPNPGPQDLARAGYLQQGWQPAPKPTEQADAR